MNTSSFLPTLMAILNDQAEIVGLPNHKLNASLTEGPVVMGNIPKNVFLKIARLQTLIVKLQESADEEPSFEMTQQIAQETGVDFLTAASNDSIILRDALVRIPLLERLIVEVVRESFPAECEHCDVRYHVHISGKIVRVPTRSLDLFV